MGLKWTVEPAYLAVGAIVLYHAAFLLSIQLDIGCNTQKRFI